MKGNLQAKNVLITLGFSFIALGIIINIWVLALLFSPDGIIESIPTRLLIWTYNLLMVLIGLLLLLKARKKTVLSKIAVNFILLIITILTVLLCGEFGLRALGYQPANLDLVKIPEPEDRLLIAHPMLGHVHRPEVVTKTFHKRKGYTFTVTHTSRGLRVTHPLETYGNEISKKQIWIFGCSFTYGWSLNDDETYPWLLQKKLPKYEIVNFGVVAYGTLQALIQFREALSRHEKPEIAIIAYASFHDERNTNLRSRQKLFVTMGMGILPQPYARLNEDGSFTYSMSEHYHEFPLMRYSALTNLVEKAYDGMEDWFIHSHDVSKAIVREFAELCQENDIELIVAGIMNDDLTTDMLEYAKGLGVLVVDMSVDLEIEGNRNLPYDTHPSALANKQYAQKLITFLRNTVLTDISKNLK